MCLPYPSHPPVSFSPGMRTRGKWGENYRNGPPGIYGPRDILNPSCKHWKQDIDGQELMDGHVILTRHGLRSSESRGCWSREGAHFGWALRQLSIETDAPLAEPLSLYFRVICGCLHCGCHQLWKVLRPRHEGRDCGDEKARHTKGKGPN